MSQADRAILSAGVLARRGSGIIVTGIPSRSSSLVMKGNAHVRKCVFLVWRGYSTVHELLGTTLSSRRITVYAPPSDACHSHLHISDM